MRPVTPSTIKQYFVMADTLNDLALIIRSRFPLVQVETREETRIMKLLERVASLEGWALFVWTVADGLKRIPPTG